MSACSFVSSLWKCWTRKRRQTASWEPNSASAGTEPPLESCTSPFVQVHTDTCAVNICFSRHNFSRFRRLVKVLFVCSSFLPPLFVPQREQTSATSWTRLYRLTRWWRNATTPTVKWSPCCANQRVSSMPPSPLPTRLRHCRAARSVHLKLHFQVYLYGQIM